MGTTAQFVCSVAGAVGNVIFTWYEKARELNNDSKYNINYMVCIVSLCSYVCVCVFVCVSMFV